MAIRRTKFLLTGAGPAADAEVSAEIPAEGPKVPYVIAREQAAALIRQLLQESDWVKAWSTLYERYKMSDSRIEIGDLMGFVLSKPDEPLLIKQVLRDMSQVGNSLYLMTAIEQIGNRRLMAALGEPQRDSLAVKLYLIFTQARNERKYDPFVEVAKGTTTVSAIACLQWMREHYHEFDELMRVVVLRCAVVFEKFLKVPTELSRQLTAILEALVRKGLTDEAPLVVWSAFELAKSLDWPVDIFDQAIPVRSKEAINSGSPEFGLPFYLVFHENPLRAHMWADMTQLWPSQTRPEMLALGDLRPIHSLADFDPDETRRAPILDAKLKRLETLIKKYGTGREVLALFLFGKGATKEGRHILVSELKNSGGTPQWYVAQGTHRLAALYAAGQRGLVPEAWLSHLPVEVVPDNGKIPRRLVRHIMTDNYNFGWQDLLPPDFVAGQRGAKPSGRRASPSSGRPHSLQSPMHMAPALWRAKSMGAAPLTMRTNRH